MKTSLCLCLAILAFATTAMGGLASEILAGKLLDVSGAEEGFKASFFGGINPIFDQLKKNGADEAMVNEMIDVAKKFYADNYKWETIRPVMAKAYAEELTDDDMKALTAFYETPAGKIAATKLAAASRKGGEAVAATLGSKKAELQAAISAVVKKHVGAKTK